MNPVPFDSKLLEGKTIEYIDHTAVNYVVFHFTDGTSVAIETEHFGHGIYGLVTVDAFDGEIDK